MSTYNIVTYINLFCKCLRRSILSLSGVSIACVSVGHWRLCTFFWKGVLNYLTTNNTYYIIHLAVSPARWVTETVLISNCLHISDIRCLISEIWIPRCSNRTSDYRWQIPENMNAYGILQSAALQHTYGLTSVVWYLKSEYRGVAQLVARQFWELDAAGSSPVTSTRLTGRPFWVRRLIRLVYVGLEPEKV